MMRKASVLIAVCCLALTLARAQPTRLTLATENRMPALHRLEVGIAGEYVELEPGRFETYGAEKFTVGPYARFGLAPNLTAVVRVPYVNYEPDWGERESGLGDVSVGLQLVAYQDVFSYPYIIPYVEQSFDTADEKRLGAGENRTKVGVSVGTTVEDVWHYALDVGYQFREDTDDVLSVAAGWVWDLNKQSSLLVEGRYTDEEFKDDDYTLLGQAGLSYRATERLTLVMYAGGGNREKVVAGMRFSFSF